MLFSLALIFLLGLILGSLFNRLKLPSLIGMIITGIIIGPYVLNLLDESILNISTDLRQMALIIILTRAGLNLNIKDLKQVGRPAILMCFLPACFEIIGILLLAPKFLGLTLLESAILGTVIAAVSPAVVVPKMLQLMVDKFGTTKGIPQLIMAGASVDDVFVIVLFTAFIGLAQGDAITPLHFLEIPFSIFLGILGGFLTGLGLSYIFNKMQIRDSNKVVIILSISFLFVSLENSLTGVIGFSGLLAVMALGTTIQHRTHAASIRLSIKFSKLWVAAEILLFVLVGATVNINYALDSGLMSIALIICALVFRLIGVFVSLLKTNLNMKERLFSALSYTPKATVQAAIGGIPLAIGLSCGNVVLTVAVLAILITAPVGATVIDSTYKKLLSREGIHSQ